MASRFEKCPPEVRAIVEKVTKDVYPDLKKSGVTFDMLFAFADRDKDDNPKGPALMKGGYVVGATVKKTSVKHRILGLADVELIIDGDEWGDRSKQEREALIDHELRHIVLEFDETGKAIVDKAGRPIIDMRNHDFQIGGFHDVIERHGRAAFEVQLLAEAVTPHLGGEQLGFVFDDPATLAKAG